jgi:uncharacterized protein YjbI with pentapeptide repeats
VSSRLALALIAAVALAAAWVGQAFAFWPFGVTARADARLDPNYGGVCEDCDLSGRIMVGARMSNSVFNRADFSNAVLARADASHSEFEAAIFASADLTRARLVDAHCRRAQFSDASLRQADARGADFRQADFSRADLAHVNLEGANLAGANLRTAEGLSQTQLDLACGDSRTRVPQGLHVRMCGQRS